MTIEKEVHKQLSSYLSDLRRGRQISDKDLFEILLYVTADQCTHLFPPFNQMDTNMFLTQKSIEFGRMLKGAIKRHEGREFDKFVEKKLSGISNMVAAQSEGWKTPKK